MATRHRAWHDPIGPPQVSAGDEVDVDVKLDTEPRHVTVPADLAAALDQDADARQRFDGLSYSKKRQHVSSIVQAKAAETRSRRIAKVIDTLREG